MREFMKKVSLLLICMPSSMMVALLTSSLIYIYQEYADFSESIVTMVLTIPNLTVMIGLLLAPYLENVKMGGSAKSAVEKKIILIKS